jgi:signal peptidase I
MLPRFGIEIDAKDICGWFDGDNTRFLGDEPERGDVVVSAIRSPVGTTSSG